MFKYFIVVSIALCSQLSFAHPVSKAAVIDTCNPSFKEIYNFQIGDVFQFVEQSSGSSGGITPTTKITSKYTITDKMVNTDTIIYLIKGIKRREYWCDGDPTPDPICDPSSSSVSFTDTLIYIDSVNHFLNKCNSELVSDFMPESYDWLQSQGFGKFFSYIRVKTENNNEIKAIGGLDNIFNYNQNDSLIIIQEVGYEEIYAKGLGKLSKNFYYFETNVSEYLQGYIKGEDTTGTITPDPDLIITGRNEISEKKLDIYPNPTNGIIHINLDEIFASSLAIEVYNISGQRMITGNISENYMDLTSLNNGIYFLKVIVDNHVLIKKILIRKK